MMSEFKKEAEAVENDLLSLLAELDKVGGERTSWSPTEYVIIDVDAAKDKIMNALKKEAGAMPVSFKGVLQPVFRQVDPPVRSTGDETCQK
jgi:hypothetical protein